MFLYHKIYQYSHAAIIFSFYSLFSTTHSVSMFTHLTNDEKTVLVRLIDTCYIAQNDIQCLML